jgi:hypothetical protein
VVTFSDGTDVPVTTVSDRSGEASASLEESMVNSTISPSADSLSDKEYKRWDGVLMHSGSCPVRLGCFGGHSFLLKI